jgi:hypothetical protein
VARCQFCGDTVFANPGAVPRTAEGGTECPVPYWVVRRGVTAVSTHVGNRGGKSAMVRAREAARQKPGLKAVRISPHGHSIR